MNDVSFRETLVSSAQDANTRFTLVLKGMEGSTPEEQVMNAVNRGLESGTDAGFTNWEFSVLHRAGRLPDVQLFDGTSFLENRFGG